MSAIDTKRTSNCRSAMSAFGGKADMAAKLLTRDEARRIASSIASCRGRCADYCGHPQSYGRWVQGIQVSALGSALAARSKASSGISKARISSTGSAWPLTSLAMTYLPLDMAAGRYVLAQKRHQTYSAARAITTSVTITNAAICSKTVFACDLSSHPGSPPFGPLTAQRSDPREAARHGENQISGRAALSVPPLPFTVTPHRLQL
jgi:hypothetical protein